MEETAQTGLLAIFVAHIAAFGVLGLRKREPYYAVPVATFVLLTASVALRLYAPGLILLGGRPLHEQMRLVALVAAGVSLGWAVYRFWSRRRSRSRS